MFHDVIEIHNLSQVVKMFPKQRYRIPAELHASNHRYNKTAYRFLNPYFFLS